MPTRNKKRINNRNEAGFVDRIREGTRSAVERAHEDLDMVRDETKHYIRQKPFSSIAIAAGIGAVVGAGVALGVSAMVSQRRKSVIDRLFDWF
ncbi:MAG: hypothetical protein Q8Q31_05405 [Nanoarchaeota archaeon]|nr:hypothetical protein [Nanoarchaeota archaeon]